MKRFETQVVHFALFAAVIAFVVGCTEKSNSGVRTPATLAKPGPEESFELILETFRRGIEGVDVGFVARREGGHSLMSGKNTVSHELIPPAKDGDPYKAIITVNSSAFYSIQRSTSDDDRKEGERRSDAESGPLNEEDPTGVDILDSDLVGSGAKPRPSQRPQLPEGDTTIARMPTNTVKKTYELLYQDGRWALMTELDKETEQGIENAFRQALKTQI
jgi:hypothetical protein